MARDRSEQLPTLKYVRPPVPVATFHLVAVEGPEVGKAFVVDVSAGGRALLGTSPACEIRIHDSHVSRRHLSLEPTADRLRVRDLGSTNGSLVNGVGIIEALLSGGELLRIGETVLRVDRAGTRAAEHEAIHTSFGRMLGANAEMRRIFALGARLAHSTVPMVIEGDTGVGKELLAECIHEQGPRAGMPFIVFDGSLVPESYVEATLFGCAPGALSGLSDGRTGLFEQAHGGTLLIDEPAELDLEVQRKLVRAVERGEIQAVGSHGVRRVDVRVIATSRADLDKAIEEGRLREDLHYRLAVGHVAIPPLRDRREDIALLAEHFWQSLGGAGTIPTSLLARLEAYAWPGNVRELQNTVARQIVTGDATAPRRSASVADFSNAQTAPVDALSEILAMDLPMPQARQRMIAEFERAYVARVLAKHGGNVSRAAASSGIAHRYFQSLKAKYASK